MYKLIQNGQTSEIQKLTHTPAHSQDVLQNVCLRVTDAVFKKSTSLPRELSAIADLNPHRYLSAATASELLWLPLQSRYIFVFQEQTREPQQSALGPFECIWRRVFTEAGHKQRIHVNTVLPQNHTTEREGGAGLTYDHSNRE